MAKRSGRPESADGGTGRTRDGERRTASRKRNLLLSLAALGAFIVVVAALLVTGEDGPGPERAGAAGGGAQAVRPDSHRLQTAPDGKVTLVEFLDFECEACRAAYPVVERLRKEYAGRITFVARYFPLPGHFNAERAARAVEAAARQGRFEAMYQRMYATQAQWGEKRVPADKTFRGFAADLKLDMAAWDRDYHDPATLTRIRRDVADGQALGVTGTPTFFLNGERLRPDSVAGFKAALDAALAR